MANVGVVRVGGGGECGVWLEGVVVANVGVVRVGVGAD